MIPQHIKDKPRMTKEFRESVKHDHGEAFCHMLYISDDGRQMEWLWNSRDGVTPFVISSETGKPMSHSYFGEDRYDPDYNPQPGDRIFVDCKPEMIRDKAWEYVTKYWNNPEYPMSKTWDTPDAAARQFIAEWAKPGSPHVSIVGDSGITEASRDRSLP